MKTLSLLALSCLALWGSGTGSTLSAQEPGQRGRTLTLAEALDIAEKRSETVGIARAGVGRAEGEQRRARSAYFPQLSGSASYQRTVESQFSELTSDDTTSGPATTCDRFVPQPGLPVDQRLDSLESAVKCASAEDPFASFRDLPFGRANTYRFGLSFSQVLFSGGQVGGRSKAAAAGVRSARLGLTSARAQTLLDVTGAYYDAALADRLLAIAQATLEQADTTLSQTRLARDVGNLSEFDLLRARVIRDNQKPVVIQRQADRDLAYYRLKQMLDIPLEEPVRLTTQLVDTAVVTSPSLTSVIDTPGDTAAAARAPVRQAVEAVEAQRGLLRVARGQRWPQASLTSQYAQLAYPGKVSPFGANFVQDWVVSLALHLPIFTGGRIGGEVAIARANLSEAELRLQQSRELAEVDARNTATQLAAAQAGWEASAGTVEQAARAYAIAELRYREGLSTQTELLDSRIQLQQAQASRARAARDLQVARVRLVLLPALPLAQPVGVGVAPSAALAAPTPASGGASTPVYQPPLPPTDDFTGINQPGAAGQ
ncbi:MAG TPA: TolC family protein [Gemmatimonadales bacterium]|nr:TolC family protein [Gemmatimonadales bacterium]